MQVMKIGNNPMYSQKQSTSEKTKPAFKATLVVLDEGLKKRIGSQNISRFLNTLGDVIKGDSGAIGKVRELTDIPSFNTVKKLIGSVLPENNPAKTINS